MTALTGEAIRARILYRDDDLIVLDKPAGIAVHKGPKGGITLDDFLPDLAFGLPRPPALAHRLDRETSGCLVLGRHRTALARLGQQFRRGEIGKRYLAVVVGRPPDEGRIDLPLARRSAERRSWQMQADPSGDPSETEFRCLARGDGLAVLELRPLTGRTHQLRVHCAANGFPIAGDPTYGGDVARAAARRLHLHAQAIEIPRRRGEEPIRVSAPIPAHMAPLFEACGFIDPVAPRPSLA